MSATSDLASSKSKNWGEKVKLFATIVGIASPVLALLTYVGAKPEKFKLLTLEYLSKGSIVNVSESAPEKIEVFYSGNKIRQVTIVSARLYNSGTLPIESSDIKDNAWPAIAFSTNLTVIGAEIKNRMPENISASINFSTNQVQILHGLLNPGDSIVVQILIDGDPGAFQALPNVFYRIIGIKSPDTRYLINKKDELGIALFNLSRNISIFVLLAASPAPLFMLIILIYGIFTTAAQMFPEFGLKKVFADQASLLNASSVEEAVKNKVKTKLSKPLDQRALTLIRASPQSAGESGDAYLERISSLLFEKLVPQRLFDRLKLIELSSVFASIVIAVPFVCIAIIIISEWHRLLASQ